MLEFDEDTISLAAKIAQLNRDMGKITVNFFKSLSEDELYYLMTIPEEILMYSIKQDLDNYTNDIGEVVH